MRLTNSDQLADQVEIEATIDDNQFLTISKVLYKATVNEPRSVTIQVSDKESLLKARLGAVLKLKIGRGDTIHNLDFEGIVKVIKPSNQTHTIVAMDRITSLASSEFFNFKDSEIIGQDLYFLVRDAADYQDIDISDTLGGSGIIANSKMGLEGLKQRKDFIDKCMEYMVKSYDDDFHDNNDFLRYKYVLQKIMFSY